MHLVCRFRSDTRVGFRPPGQCDLVAPQPEGNPRIRIKPVVTESAGDLCAQHHIAPRAVAPVANASVQDISGLIELPELTLT